MIMDPVTVSLAGLERTVPRALLDAYKSIGWRELGADPKQPKEPSVAPKAKTRRKHAK